MLRPAKSSARDHDAEKVVEVWRELLDFGVHLALRGKSASLPWIHEAGRCSESDVQQPTENKRLLQSLRVADVLSGHGTVKVPSVERPSHRTRRFLACCVLIPRRFSVCP